MMKALFAIFLLSGSCLIAAESKILIEPANINFPETTISEAELNNYYQTQSEILRSDLMMKRVSKKIQTEQKPTVTVSRMAQTSIFTVKVTGMGDKDGEYLDALLNEFIAYKKELRVKATAATKKTLENEIANTSDPKLKAALQQKLQVADIETEISSDVISILD